MTDGAVLLEQRCASGRITSEVGDAAVGFEHFLPVAVGSGEEPGSVVSNRALLMNEELLLLRRAELPGRDLSFLDGDQ